jgi:hypothetical protein
VFSLNGDIDDAFAVYHVQEITVTDSDAATPWLFKYLKQHNHHKADHKPKSKVLIKRVQFEITSINILAGSSEMSPGGPWGFITKTPCNSMGSNTFKVPNNARWQARRLYSRYGTLKQMRKEG